MSTPNPSPVSTNLEQQHKLAKDLIARGARRRRRRARPHPRGAIRRRRVLATARARRRPARHRPRGRLRLVAEARGRLRRSATSRRSARRCAPSDVPRTRAARSRSPTCARASTIRCSTSASAPRTSPRRTWRCWTVLIAAGADVNLQERLAERPLHRARQRRRGHGAIPAGARRDADAERRGATRLVRRAAARSSTPTPRSCTRAAATASSRCTRRRPSRLPTSCSTAAPGIDVRCIDHKSTPAQYALVDRPDVCRRLLERGATPDIFMAARLGDVALATRLLDADPACARRPHQRARLRAGAAVQHLLLVARVRPVAARRRR